MAEATSTHKQRNEPTIKGFVRANIVIFFVVSGVVPLIQGGTTAISAIEAGMAALASIVWSILTSVLCNLLPTRVKESLVFWRVKDVLPGCRAFTVLGKGDSRVDMTALQERFGELPKTPRSQNEFWYKLFNKYEATTPAIAEDHSEYLLFRDLTAVSLLLVPALGGPTFFFASCWMSSAFLGGLAAVFVLLSLVARSKGNRLVCNVLATESRS